MIDELIAKYRTISQVKRQEGTLIYRDLIEANKFFDEKCPYSGTPIDEANWHLEHIIPIKMGGTTDPWNCVPVCKPCNLSKGANHLLDWWDKTHKIEEEEKLEKIYLYLIQVLMKDRKIRITTESEKQKLAQLEKETIEIEQEILNDDYIETTKKLDTFTFMYQLLNHLKDSNQIEEEKIIKYELMLEEVQNENNDIKRLDIDEYKIQKEFTNYLKSIGVINHYSIPYEYSNKIRDINEIKENVNNISKYLEDVQTSDLINKNPEILFMNINIFKYNFEYLKNNLKMTKELIIRKPIFLSEIDLAKELYEISIKVNFDIFNITNYAFDRGSLKNL